MYNKICNVRLDFAAANLFLLYLYHRLIKLVQWQHCLVSIVSLPSSFEVSEVATLLMFYVIYF